MEDVLHNLNYRDQWPGIGRTYVTYSASYDQHIDVLGGGTWCNCCTRQKWIWKLNILYMLYFYSYLLEVNRDLIYKAWI